MTGSDPSQVDTQTYDGDVLARDLSGSMAAEGMCDTISSQNLAQGEVDQGNIQQVEGTTVTDPNYIKRGEGFLGGADDLHDDGADMHSQPDVDETIMPQLAEDPCPEPKMASKNLDVSNFQASSKLEMFCNLWSVFQCKVIS